MITKEIIEKKAKGLALESEEIDYMVQGYTQDSIPDYQMAAFLMAVKLQGMSAAETSALTLSMIRSGDQIDLSDLPGVKLDKHSTGGVGDTTTLVVVPIVAACGCTVVKMSGRGLGHTGGTIDKLEAIPGYHPEMTENEMKTIAAKTGAVLAGQSGDLAPADKKIYALRDVTGTVDSIPLIASSIMSKKIASGADAIVLDVKIGSGALLPDLDSARELSRLMVDIGSNLGRKVVALLTDMDQPLGKAIGNVLEVREAVQLLSGEIPQTDPLYAVCIELASYMLMMGKGVGKEEAVRACINAVQSGKALQKFQEILSASGVDTANLSTNGIELLCKVKTVTDHIARQRGYVVKIHAEQLGKAAQILGAGRLIKEDVIDPAVGIIMEKRLGDFVEIGDEICAIYSNNDRQLEEARNMIDQSIILGDQPPQECRLIYDVIS